MKPVPQMMSTFHFNIGGFYCKIKHILKVSLGTGMASLITWGYSCFHHVHNLMAEPTPDELKFDNLYLKGDEIHLKLFRLLIREPRGDARETSYPIPERVW